MQSVETTLGHGNGAAKKAVVMAAIAGAPPEVHEGVSTFIDSAAPALSPASPAAPIVSTQVKGQV
jgi:hypothetical protein